MSEHFLIRNARTMTFSAACPLQPTINNLFIGAIQYMAENPKSYTMDSVSEAVEAHKKASVIAEEREEQARKARALEREQLIQTPI
jgi:hypothetical protein